MIIDNDLLDKVAYLSRLALLCHERNTMLHDLNEIVTWMEQLDKLQLDDSRESEPRLLLDENRLRPDVVSNTLTHEQALRLAPSSDSHYFQLPAVKGI